MAENKKSKAAEKAETTEQAVAAEKAETIAKAATPKKVKVKLPLTRTEKDDVFVGLNGKTYLIKRGVEVEVPYGVAKILERREKMLSIAMEYEEAAAAPLVEMAKM